MTRLKFPKIQKLILLIAAPVALATMLSQPVSADPYSTPATQPVSAQPASCPSCGVIADIRAVGGTKKKKKKASALGTVAGAVIGGVAGHAVGHGKTQGTTTVVGAVAGGVVGNQVSKNNSGGTVSTGTAYYIVSVRMDNGGGTETVNLHSVQGLSIGERVMLDNGNIILQ